MYMLYLDLDELDRVFAGRWLWSVDGRNLARIPPQRLSRRSGQCRSTRAVRARVCEALPARARRADPAAHASALFRTLLQSGQLLLLLRRGRRDARHHRRRDHQHAVEGAPQPTCCRSPARRATARALRWEFAKAFHVSPFLPMQRDYDWRFTAPDEDLRVHMDVHRATAERANSTRPWCCDAAPLNARESRTRAAALSADDAAQVVAAIHWQALRLWLRRNPVYDHPEQSARSMPTRHAISAKSDMRHETVPTSPTTPPSRFRCARSRAAPRACSRRCSMLRDSAAARSTMRCGARHCWARRRPIRADTLHATRARARPGVLSHDRAATAASAPARRIWMDCGTATIWSR